MKLFSLILLPISTLAVTCSWEPDQDINGDQYKVLCEDIAVAGDLDSIDWNLYKQDATELKLKMVDGHNQFDDDDEMGSIVSALKKFQKLNKLILHGFDGLLTNRIVKANPTVTELQVKKTQLATFPANLFKDSNIESFHVKDSEVQTIDHTTFKNQDKLRKVRIENSKIDNVEDIAFKYLEDLEHLDMSQNDINTVSTKVFKMLPNLKNLDLANNKLTSLPTDIFKFNTELRVVNLNGNDFTELPCDLFKFQQKLSALNVTNNKLTHLQCHLVKRQGEKLKNLDMTGNELDKRWNKDLSHDRRGVMWKLHKSGTKAEGKDRDEAKLETACQECEKNLPPRARMRNKNEERVERRLGDDDGNL